MLRNKTGASRGATWALFGVGVAVGIVVGLLTSDVILGVIAGSGLIAVAVGLLRAWNGDSTSRLRHP